MSKYKMIALAYNKISESKGDAVLSKFLDSTNGFLEADARVVISRYTKILIDLEKLKKECRVNENAVAVFRLKYDIHKPSQHDDLLGKINNTIKKTNISVVVLLEFQQLRAFYDLQDFQCDYGTDGGVEQFFSLIIAEQENDKDIEIRILKNKHGGLYVL